MRREMLRFLDTVDELGEISYEMEYLPTNQSSRTVLEERKPQGPEKWMRWYDYTQ